MIDTPDYSSQSNNSHQKNNYSSKAKLSNFWRSLIYLMLLSLGGGISYSWYFLTQEMIPMIEKPVSAYLSRPIKLGEVKAVSLTSIVIGKSYLPATNQENDFLVAQEVEIKINLWELVNNKVELEIILHQAQGYLQQDNNNSWLKLQLRKNKDNAKKWRFTVNEIIVKNSNLTIKSNQYQGNISPKTNEVKIPVAKINFENPQLYTFNLQGNLVNGGKIVGNGLYKPQGKNWLLKLNNKDLPIDTVNQIVKLPININSGVVTGELKFNFANSKLDLNSLEGKITLDEANVVIPNLVQTLTKSSGNLTFADGDITLTGVKTNFGLISTRIEGVISNYRELDLIADTNKSTTIDNVLTSLKINKGKLVTKGKIQGKINITGKIKQPVVKAKIINDRNLQIDQIPINQLLTNLTIENRQLSFDNIEIVPTIGGKINGRGNISLNRQNSSFNLDWQGKNIDVKKLANLYQQNVPDIVGNINGEYNINGNWQQINRSKLTGVATVELSSGKAVINQLKIDNQTWQGKVNLSSFPLAELPNLDCNKIGCQNSLLDGTFQVSGKTNNFSTDSINLLGDFNFNLAENKVRLENTQINGSNWQTSAKINNFDISQLPSVNLTSSPIKNNIDLSANLQIAGNFNNRENIEIKGKGNLNLPQGDIQINNFTLQKDNFIAQTFTKNFTLTNINPTLRGDAIGDLTIVGNINQLQPQFITVDGNLNLTKGISVINQPLDVAFRWNGNNIQIKKAIINDGIQAKGIINYDLNKKNVTDINLDVNAQQVNIDRLPLPKSLALLNYQGKINFQGKLAGNVSSPQLKGKVDVDNLQLANLRFSPLQGDLIASSTEGVSLNLDSLQNNDKLSLRLNQNYQPQNLYLQTDKTKIQGKKIDGNLAFNLENIPLNQVTQPWLSYFPSQVDKVGGSLSGEINLNLTDYNVTDADVVIIKPQVNHLQGDILTTQLTSNNGIFTITKGSLKHQTNQYDFTGELNPFAENPQLQANLQVAKGNLQNLLTSLQFFELGDIPDGFKPRKYATSQDLYSSASNFEQNDENRKNKTETDVNNFLLPIRTDDLGLTSSSAKLKTESIKDIGVSNQLDKQTESVTDTNNISQFETQTQSINNVSYSDELDTEKEQEFIPDTSNQSETIPVEKYTSSTASNQLKIKEKSESANSSLSQINNSLKSTKPTKPLISINSGDKSLLDNLSYYRQIENQVAQENRERVKATLPKLEELNGDFTGDINLTASVDNGVNAEFDFLGDKWQWGKYEGDLLQLSGSYKNGLLTFRPVTIKSNESILSLTGTFQPEKISGDINLANFPVSQLKPFLNIPDSFDIKGDINANIAVSGSQEKPSARGNIEIVDSTINGNSVEKATASLGFRNSRIDFLAKSSFDESIDYFTVIASIPFKLFPNSIEPDNNDFKVKFDLEKEGFSLLGIATDNRLNWIDGNGNIDLDIKGKYNQARNEVSQIQTEGIASFEDGIINGEILNQEPITNINGQVLFNFAQLNISNLSGNFNGGQISLLGSLPIVNKDIKGQSLDILFDNLSLNLDNLYRGEANGNLTITGSSIEPSVSGNITMTDGDIKIAKKENNSTTKKTKKNNFNGIEVNDLSLVLGDNIHISQPILLRLKAEGSLNLNGSLNSLSPEGIINLRSGKINLFTSQLKLVEGRNNIAKFTPENGFNPYLDLQLETYVTQASRYQLPNNSNSNEIEDLSNFAINTAQTIKIKADIQGRSDNLNNNIELSSNPSRNQTEIVALLGGGFINNFASENSELNLLNFASAAVLGGIQGALQETLGFDEFRLFPTQIIDSKERTSTFGLGAELALDLTDDFSISVTKIITNSQAPRYSLRYHLNEDIIIRGSSNFEQDSRAVIEFQRRF